MSANLDHSASAKAFEKPREPAVGAACKALPPLTRPALTYRLATAADVALYYGEHRPPFTLQAVVLELDGERVGIIGLGYRGSYLQLFSDHRPALEPHLKRKAMAILRGLKVVMGWAQESPLPILATPSEHEPGSRALLIRLGFEFRANDEDGNEIYRYG
jgi:hypothetical protein